MTTPTREQVIADLRLAALNSTVGDTNLARLTLPWLAADMLETQTPKEIAIKPLHEAADAFWRYWRENGETHRHGYYESTWGAINAALRIAGTVAHDYGNIKL